MTGAGSTCSRLEALLGGSWVVISGVISRVTIVITHIRGLITPLITAHEPPSTRRLHGAGAFKESFWGCRA